MPNELTPVQQKFLDGLRSGDIHDSGIKIEPTLTNTSRENIRRFQQFLVSHGHSDPRPDDLYLAVDRNDFLSILHYADDRECLGLQCCFGFSIPPVIDIVEPAAMPPGIPGRVLRKVGQVLLIQKGNFHKTDSRSAEDYFNGDTVFRNQTGTKELFRDMTLNQPISEDKAISFLNNFRAMYPAEDSSHILGYLLPVKAFLTICSDSSQPLANTDRITFQWGLTGLGNFSLIIGTDNLVTGPTIELGKDIIRESGNDPELPPCPPTPGCQ